MIASPPNAAPESGLLARLAAAASVLGHLALLAAIVLYAGVHPFHGESTRPISVDLVAPDQIPPPEPPAKPPEAKPPEPDATPPDLKPSMETHAPQSPAAPPQSPQQQQQHAPPPQAAPDRHADAPQPAQPPSSPAPAPPSAAPPAFTPPEPDLTVKYGVPLGLPAQAGKSDFDAAAVDAADLASADIAAFRRHLKTCSPLPDTVAASDDVWIKLRATFTLDGRLAAPPALIEGKASPKAIALAHAAIAALQACQPYAMLPVAKYNEWRVLDLEFSPRDFSER